MVSGEPAAAADPTEGSFDHPASGLHGEALLPLLGLDDLDGDGGGGADALTPVSAIGEAVRQEGHNLREARRSATPPWLSCRSAGETAATSRRPSVSVSA